MGMGIVVVVVVMIVVAYCCCILLLHIVVAYCCCILLLSFWIVRYASENDRWVMIHHHPAVPSLEILTVIFLFILWPRLSMLICYFVP